MDSTIIYLFSGFDFTADVIEDQVKAVSIATAVATQLHSALTRPAGVWFVLTGVPRSLNLNVEYASCFCIIFRLRLGNTLSILVLRIIFIVYILASVCICEYSLIRSTDIT